MSAESLESHLFSRRVLKQIEADTFVRCVEFHPQLPSTNDLALQLAGQDDVELPLLIVAERQTDGRGRGANRWWAGAGALTFSVVIETDIVQLPPERWPQVSLTAGLAVCETLRELLPAHDLKLKWPNDVFLDGRKVCGILVEVPPRGRGRLILGIGININNSFAAVPAELRQIATSLYDASGCHYELPDVLTRVLRQLDNRLQLLSTGRLQFAESWRAVCLLRGRRVHLDVGGRSTIGLCQGIDHDGALLLQDESGLKRFFSGIVTQFD
jgi:BirA family transcriptional regulator, biotin operon repressor / biotin---[acetyl-CoA-carboxylase] ligase